MADEIKSLDDLKAAVAAAPVAEVVAPRAPQRDKLGRSYATGKRKDAVARVWIKPGSGKVVVNGKTMPEYFARPVLQMILRQPFTVAGVEGQFDVHATVAGVLLGLVVPVRPRRRGVPSVSNLDADTDVAHRFEEIGAVSGTIAASEVPRLAGLAGVKSVELDSEMRASDR